ncbi:MAG TPA: hypothetical protein VD907_05700 [Verrucomicrobiae bacterium]|nr:hypothetical protein [Verrucomicrobiae bacterium]
MKSKVQRLSDDEIKNGLMWLTENHAFSALPAEMWEAAHTALLRQKKKQYSSEDAVMAVVRAFGKADLDDVFKLRVTPMQVCWLLACLLPASDVLAAAKARVCPVPYARQLQRP